MDSRSAQVLTISRGTPTAPPPVIRTTTALSAAFDLHLHSIDISNAFLNGDIDVDIYMRQPDGFVLGGRNMVCKLNKGIYGTKQGVHAWQIKLRQILVKELGFSAIYSAGSVFVYRSSNDLVLLPFHVDDGTFASSSHELNKMLVVRLAHFFKLHDLGLTEFLLGIAVKQDLVAGTVELSQRQYVIEILDRFAMSCCASVTTPMAPGLRLSRADSPQTDEEHAAMIDVPYGNAVGTLLYLATSTRPDISFTVATLCRFIANLGVKHWNVVEHLLRYLQGMKDARLVYRHDLFDLRTIFTAYCDADHAGNADNGRSTSGYALLIAGAAVSWSSRLQTITALSTTEAEYVAAVDAGKEVAWMRQLLHKFGFTLSGPLTLAMDDQSAISVAKNPEHHGRMKHLDLRFDWLHNAVDDGRIAPGFVPTAQQVADIFTKSLVHADMQRCRESLGIVI